MVRSGAIPAARTTVGCGPFSVPDGGALEKLLLPLVGTVQNACPMSTVDPTAKFDHSRASEYETQSRIALAGYDACLAAAGFDGPLRFFSSLFWSAWIAFRSAQSI